MKTRKLRYDEAFEHVKKSRTFICPNRWVEDILPLSPPALISSLYLSISQLTPPLSSPLPPLLLSSPFTSLLTHLSCSSQRLSGAVEEMGERVGSHSSRRDCSS
jgi:hypothetical protein